MAQPTPPTPPTPLKNTETPCGCGASADPDTPRSPGPASKPTSLSGSRRTSEQLSDAASGDVLLNDLLRSNGLLGDGVDDANSYGLFGNRGSLAGATTPLREIMEGATVPNLPRYIFKAHEMTTEVRTLLQDDSSTDVTFVAADEEIPAHRKVLKAHGGSLYKLVEEAGGDGRVKISDMSSEVLLEVLRFVYTGTAPAVGRIPKVLLAAAHSVGLVELKGRCSEVLVQRLDIHNVAEMFEIADKNAEERLKQAAAVMFLDNAKEIYDTDEWHASLDLRPAAAMRLVHIAVTKSTMDMGSMSTGTRIVHLIARIYMVAIVPVIGYVLYSTVRNKLRMAKGLDGANGTRVTDDSTAAAVVADVITSVVNHTVAVATGVEDDEFFSSASDEL